MIFPYHSGEITLIRRQEWLSESSHSRLTLVYGERRAGKTAAVAEALKDIKYIYIAAGGKNPALSLEEAKRHCRHQLGIEITDNVKSLADLFSLLIGESWTKKVVLVLDEFQEYWKSDPDFCRYIAKRWKAEKAKTNMNLILISSNREKTDEIFFKPGGPFINQVDEAVHIGPLSASALKGVLSAANPSYKPLDLLALYCVSGGRPAAVKHFIEGDDLSAEGMIARFSRNNDESALATESFLYRLLGKNSDTYLSILLLVAAGFKTQAEMEQKLGGMIIGGHLAKLENEYELLRKQRPSGGEASSRGVVRYSVADPSVKMWLNYFFADRARRMMPQESDVRFPDDFREELRDLFLSRFSESGDFTEPSSWWYPVGRLSRKPAASSSKSVSEETRDIDIIAGIKGSRKVLVAAVETSAGNFQKEPFLAAVEQLKNSSLKGKSPDIRLFTPDDL